MSNTIYRKYRPQSFSDLVGQNHIKITLENEIITDRMAHAYLFAGPRGIGKTTTARLFAKAVNCQNRKKDSSEPCNTCDACVEVTEAKSLDLIEMDAASHTGVENVRDNIIENARFTPTRWKYKVFIIDEAHMLSLAAFNALLKTLEEPPSHAIFILCTTEVHKFPETIISRCQRFDFKKIGHADLIKRLKTITEKEKVKVDDEVLAGITHQSDGSLRDAESLLGQIFTLGEKRITAEMAELVLPRSNIETIARLFDCMVDRKTGDALDLLNTLSQEGVNYVQFSKELIEFLRKILLIKVNGRLDIFSSLELTKDMEKSALDQAESIELSRLTHAINLILDRERDIKYSNIPQLPLELAIVEICEGRINADENSQPHEEPPVSPTIPKTESKPVITPKPIKASATKSTLDEIKSNWDKIISHLQQGNPSLALKVQLARPIALEGNELTLDCSYAFHTKQLNESSIRLKIEEAIEYIMKTSIRIGSVIVQEKAHESEEDKKSEMNPILETFGGKVVG
ncbi:DNA polymerase III subunit gamma/tau [Patescibacteria group bacterium]|nr:DNA polymerase III subunit gamma/tau [Patescibacteria group bacterium]MBU1889953.1 DNA polymerase III subunit gamma/tau [Patescibacteria group bacterium]